VKILLIGARGQLGTDLHRVLENRNVTVVPLTHADLDVRDTTSVRMALFDAQPDVLINTSAFHKVEECETQPQLAFEVNALAVGRLARACAESGTVLVHFSTDYVFDGAKKAPYEVEDRPTPLNVYGVAKAAGEMLIPFNTDRYFVIRTCGLYGHAGSSGKGGNFVENMLKRARDGQALRVVNDQVLTPTATADVAEMVGQLLTTDAYGLYHVTSEGECSWYEFTRKILELEGLRNELKPVSTAEFPSPVKRPSYSVLGKRRLNALGLGTMAHWEDALRRYLRARVPAVPSKWTAAP
jgi:dTDP-4-dehydrorhamnose reductase